MQKTNETAQVLPAVTDGHRMAGHDYKVQHRVCLISIEAKVLRAALHLTGHVICMDSSHMPRQLLHQGQPRKRYKDCSKDSHKHIGIPSRRLEPCAQDRTGWCILTKSPFANLEGSDGTNHQSQRMQEGLSTCHNIDLVFPESLSVWHQGSSCNSHLSSTTITEWLKSWNSIVNRQPSQSQPCTGDINLVPSHDKMLPYSLHTSPIIKSKLILLVLSNSWRVIYLVKVETNITNESINICTGISKNHNIENEFVPFHRQGELLLIVRQLNINIILSTLTFSANHHGYSTKHWTGFAV